VITSTINDRAHSSRCLSGFPHARCQIAILSNISTSILSGSGFTASAALLCSLFKSRLMSFFTRRKRLSTESTSQIRSQSSNPPMKSCTTSVNLAFSRRWMTAFWTSAISSMHQDSLESRTHRQRAQVPSGCQYPLGIESASPTPQPEVSSLRLGHSRRTFVSSAARQAANSEVHGAFQLARAAANAILRYSGMSRAGRQQVDLDLSVASDLLPCNGLSCPRQMVGSPLLTMICLCCPLHI